LLVVLTNLLMIILVEVFARFAFPTLADDRKYFNTIDRRILNSHPIFDPKGNEKFGEVLPRNWEHTFRTDEFEYTAHTNSLGFRTREIEVKSPDEWRVMMVGDSMFWSVAKDEDTIASQLERIARETPALTRTVKAYNFGLFGYTTVQEWIVTTTYAPLVQPDHIILGTVPVNDTIPNAVQYVDDQGNLAISWAAVKRVQEDIRSRIGWLQYSMIFRLLSVSPYTTRLYYQIASEPYILEKNYALFEQFAEYCRRHEIQLTVVMIHCEDGIEGGLHGAWTQSRSVVRTLANSCRSRGIDTIDLVDFISGYQASRELFYKKDGHYNPKGNRRIAEILFEKAVKDRWRKSDRSSTPQLQQGAQSRTMRLLRMRGDRKDA
jgi:hypothetical protein